MAKSLILTIAQINPVVGSLEHNIGRIRKAWESAPPNSDIIVFPELFLTGYPPEDLLLKSAFIDHVEQSISLLADQSRGRAQAIIVGAPSRDKTRIYNSAYLIHDGKVIAVRSKRELPNYGVFDEKRYFTPGDFPDPIDFRGTKLGLMICEDMWHPEVSSHLKERGAELLIVINSSPYDVHKYQVRLQHAELRVQKTGLPLVYVNQVGSQGDLVFDGASFILNQEGRLIMQCEEFVEELQDVTLEQEVPGHWLISTENMHPLHTETEAIYQAAMTGLRDYIEKDGIPGVILGMSGGIDSALSAAIAVDALGADRVHCVMMPSPYTSEMSKIDALDCAKRLGISHEEVPLASLIKAFGDLKLGRSGTAHENIQSRLRGLILMTLSNQSGKIVLSTSNKSEIAVGYSTLYGDTCGGYNCLKDVYKTQVYNLSTWRNSAKPVNALGPDGEVINQSILAKAPTAELRLNQRDQDSLPPYDELDPILTCFIEEDLELEQIIERGHDPEAVEKVRRLLYTAEYKRNQSPPGPKVSPRAFDRERRYPLVNGYSGKPVKKTNS